MDDQIAVLSLFVRDGVDFVLGEYAEHRVSQDQARAALERLDAAYDSTRTVATSAQAISNALAPPRRVVRSQADAAEVARRVEIIPTSSRAVAFDIQSLNRSLGSCSLA
jgi:hypothetical protein